MLDRLAPFHHPDERGEWVAGPVALGHLLVRLTPEDSFERQPLASPDGRYVLCADLRLDNREELARELGIAPATARELPDSSFVMGAYRKWGERCPERLLGDFAFALWDSRERRLFCARDHMGVRPFYYFHGAETFAFATAIKGLLALPEVPRLLNETALADYLVLLEEDLEATFYEGVLRLPAAHTLVVDAEGRCRLSRYWSPDPGRELRLGSDTEYREAFREQMNRAVERRLRSSGPSAVMLSGGLDSSSVACLAARALAHRGERLIAVSAVLPEDHEGPERDEWDHIQAVAAQEPNIEGHRVTAEGTGLLTDLEAAFEINDEPFRDLFHYMTRALVRTAAERGATNLLWGLGGDHLVSSKAQGYLAELARSGRLRVLMRELRGRVRLGDKSFKTLLKNELIAPLLPEPFISAYRRLRGRSPIRDWIASSMISPDFARRVGLEERLKDFGLAQGVPSFNTVRAHQHRDIVSSANARAMEYAAHLGAALGLRLQTPLFDKQLLEHCLALPVEQKARDGWPRWAIRSGLEGVLPTQIQWRRDKSPFSPDFFRRVSRDRELIGKVLESTGADEAARSYLDIGRIRDGLDTRSGNQMSTARESRAVPVAALGLVGLQFLHWTRNRV
jgi:asparagine synthase (glutamine-hydrolysing)